jgi:hypothetical protein
MNPEGIAVTIEVSNKNCFKPNSNMLKDKKDEIG